jgi:acyl carrier protein|tara:strand:- start:61 stop:303 length:243 start_codon:yes stop_codon:yes gene_type:complete
MNKITENDLFGILSDVFPATTLPEDSKGLEMGSFKEWDSLGNFNLLLAVEEHFEIRFTMDEITNIKSLAQITETLNARDA